MKPRIYVETSVISYLAARPSADAVKATRQHFSYRLWQKRGQCDLLVSRAVLAEASVGDDEAVRNRLIYCDALASLATPKGAEELADHLLRVNAVPQAAYADAMHIAIAALQGVQYVASWNFRHIVGAAARRNIEMALADIDAPVPVIATPEEILESMK